MSTVLIFFFLVEAPIASRVRVLATKPSPPVHPCTGCPRLQRVAAISKENPQTILGIALFPFRPALQGPSEMRPGGLGGHPPPAKKWGIGAAPRSALPF